MSKKTIVTCLACGQRLRIPITEETIVVSCPCGSKFDCREGEPSLINVNFFDPHAKAPEKFATAWRLFQDNKFLEAVETLQELVLLNPTSSRIQLALSVVYMRIAAQHRDDAATHKSWINRSISATRKGVELHNQDNGLSSEELEFARDAIISWDAITKEDNERQCSSTSDDLGETPQDTLTLPPLHKAAVENNTTAVRELLACGSDVDDRDEKGATPLHLAANRCSTEVAQLLLAHGADPNSRTSRGGQTPLHAAAHAGFPLLAVLDLLREHGADIEARDDSGNTALHWAAMRGHCVEAEFLVIEGADVDARRTDGNTPLLLAALQGYEGVISALIHQGANVNIVGTGGLTPLYYATVKGHLASVKVLLESKADVNVQSNDGVTALWMAAWQGHTDIVKALLESKADVNVQRKTDGGTALWQAAWLGHTEIVKLLLESKADVNAANRTNGVTPLFIASVQEHTMIVKLLLEAKADVNVKARKAGKDYTPLSIAKEMGHKEIVKLLTEYGVKD